MKRDRIDQTGEMTAFVAAAQEGSLSAAARRLDLTPSAVSRIVQRLEARLGVQLVVRTTRRFRLTAEGVAYARSARRILADIAEVERSVADQGSPRGRVRITMPAAYARLVLLPLLAEFVTLYPEISLDLDVGDELADVMGGEVDVAIRSGPLADSPLTARRLCETGRSVVASPAYLARVGAPAAPADLARHNCLDFGFRRAEAGWPFREGERTVVRQVGGTMTANSGETLVQLALGGHGITRVADFHVAEHLASGRLTTLLDDFNPRDREPLHAVYIGGAMMPARNRALVDFLAERMSRRRAQGAFDG
ncbi:LysR family transcriptional regulator [Albimonas pacifica]|uniref:DNA-binding transcriptional regulator, LysR family n=1 Tax=Albimonas pacifica TaxID=1114924 RepID=A0A1I3FTV6_9RHOB|nr:LysR family transcriptional regulator [Albimonas pacifica]SFI14666.1 DNA-binding transcriptional regulator, LysR family [Albimonas pacifica]